jgi:hypothetical protein
MLLPLFISLNSSNTWIVNSATTTVSHGYGSDASALLALLASILILVFQIHSRLAEYCRPS